MESRRVAAYSAVQQIIEPVDIRALASDQQNLPQAIIASSITRSNAWP
jgi:hypothetical protein